MRAGTGTGFPKQVPEEFQELRKKYKKGEISGNEAGRQLGISGNTFRDWVKRDVQKERNELVEVTRLQAIRSEMSMTVGEFVKFLGISRGLYQKYEKGYITLPKKRADSICEKCGIEDKNIDLQETIKVPLRLLIYRK